MKLTNLLSWGMFGVPLNASSSPSLRRCGYLYNFGTSLRGADVRVSRDVWQMYNECTLLSSSKTLIQCTYALNTTPNSKKLRRPWFNKIRGGIPIAAGEESGKILWKNKREIVAFLPNKYAVLRYLDDTFSVKFSPQGEKSRLALGAIKATQLV